MKHSIRRVLLAVGLALFAGGWGVLRYADQRSQVNYVAPSRKLYGGGVGCMVLGAGLVGFGLPALAMRKSTEQ
jgi:hypothetical protein